MAPAGQRGVEDPRGRVGGPESEAGLDGREGLGQRCSGWGRGGRAVGAKGSGAEGTM